MVVQVGTLDGLVLWKILRLHVLVGNKRQPYLIHCIVMHLAMKLIQVSNWIVFIDNIAFDHTYLTY